MSGNLENGFQHAFRQEAEELLQELEDALLSLEEVPHSVSYVDRVFRALHTLKGSGAMFGFERVVTLSHETESVFDLVKNGRLGVDSEMIDLTLRVRDSIRSALEAGPEEGEPSAEELELIAALRRIAEAAAHSGSEHGGSGAAGDRSSSVEPEASSAVSAAGKGASETPKYIFRVRFSPPSEVFLRGADPTSLLDELRELGECEVIAHTSDVPRLGELDPQYCHCKWDIILTTSHDEDTVRGVFIFVEEDSELVIDYLEDPAEEAPRKLGEILVERGDVSPDAVESVLKTKQPLGRMLVEQGLVTGEAVHAALVEQQRVQSVQQRTHQEQRTGSVRVDLEKLDTLVDLVGEAVTSHARLSRTVTDDERSDLSPIVEELGRHVTRLREVAMGMRMVPIGQAFSRFQRVTRDLSRQLGKDVRLVTGGGETELDKRIIERLTDPLLHLVRNAVDHGMEDERTRKEAGKPAQGTVQLRAGQAGGMVNIEVSDDGKGLDDKAILRQARERGLVGNEAELTEEEIYGLIFEPGFSTVSEVSDLSGRGVGMDVVKRTIEALNGTLKVRSEHGSGTVVSLQIPLTLAIVDGLLLRIGDRHYVVPLASVDECVEFTSQDQAGENGQRLVEIRGKLVPYLDLRQLFEIKTDAPNVSQLVIVSSDDDRIGLLVEEVVGQMQAVIKALGPLYRNVEGVSGATILGTGEIALILDTPRLVNMVTTGIVGARR